MPKCGITYSNNSGKVGLSTTIIVTKLGDNTDAQLTVFRNQLEVFWEKLSNETFPVDDATKVAEKLLEKDVLFN